jgi:hypothetical protein
MTKEEKQILLVDLCARLPYDVEVRITFPDGSGCEEVFDARDLGDIEDSIYDETDKQYPLYLPYLRSISTMTEDERLSYYRLYDNMHFENLYSCDRFDWFMQHHFDIRGLIKKGLALEAPEGMYNN